MQQFCVTSADHGNRKRRTVNAAPDVRPATANLWPHRERRRRARRRRSPQPPERSSREAADLDWARTFSDSSSANVGSSILLKQASRPALGVSTLPDGAIDLKQEYPRPYFGADRGVYRFDGRQLCLTVQRLLSLQSALRGRWE